MNYELYKKLLLSRNWDEFNEAYNNGDVSRGVEEIRLNNCPWPAYSLYKFFHRLSGDHIATFKSLSGFGGFTRIDTKTIQP